jgi:alanyl-tRNA synthetase
MTTRTTQRLYYDDSFERSFETEVLACTPVAPGSTPAGSAAVWEVVLDRTAFYPASGGQPHDLGMLGEARVLDVRDAGDEIVHVVDRPLEKGKVAGSINWERRFDHMQQHTGQHLLSAIFQERFGLPTVSFHLGSESSTIDLHGPEPGDHILEGAERFANEKIFEDRPVNVRYDTAEALAQLGARKEVDRGGILRAIEIEATDLQPCGGTHVKRTGQIGVLLVRRCTKIRQDWRVEFVCGSRAVRAAHADFLLLRRVAERLGCAADDVVASAERAIADREAQFKNARAVSHRLAEVEAALLLQTTAPGADSLRVIVRVLENADAEYLGQLATQLAKAEKTIALLAARDGGHLVFAQHPSSGKDMNTLLKKVLQQMGGKGGGTRDFARGRLADPAVVEQTLEAAKAAMQS